MQRGIFFVFGVLCHALFFVVFAYMAGFVGNFIVPNPLMLQLFLCKGLPTCAEAGSNSLTS